MKKIILLSMIISQLAISCTGNDEQNQDDKNSTLATTKEIHICTELTSLKNVSSTAKQNATIYTSSKWIPGQIIRIKFLNGDNFLQEKVKQYANNWMTYANVNFQYVSANEEADIKIGFKWNGDGGSWSYLGKGCQSISQTTPSMNFGWFNANTTETEFNRTIMHEFGHSIGLIHEHQSPVGNILWNKPKVYEYYQQTQGWSIAQVDNNIFAKYSETQTNYSAYDNGSIMHYPIEASLTTDGYSVGLNTDLSSNDKIFIRKMYPFPIQSNLRQGMRLNEFNRITSPNGRFYLTIRSGKLIIYDDVESKNIWSLSPNIKLSNVLSTLIYCELRGGELLLFKGSVSKKVIGDISLPLQFGDYATINNSGDIELIKDGIVVWSLFRGKLY